jgi:hypothetical protein
MLRGEGGVLGDFLGGGAELVDRRGDAAGALACWSELNIDEFEAATTRSATSLTWPVAEDTSRIEV